MLCLSIIHAFMQGEATLIGEWLTGPGMVLQIFRNKENLDARDISPRIHSSAPTTYTYVQ